MDNQEHIDRLVRALGNPCEWSYTGEWVDHGAESRAKCSCGHPIRWEFILKHPDGRTAPIGSICIETYAGINKSQASWILDDSFKAQSAAHKAVREAKKAAKIEAYIAAQKRMMNVWETVRLYLLERSELGDKCVQLGLFGPTSVREIARIYKREYRQFQKLPTFKNMEKETAKYDEEYLKFMNRVQDCIQNGLLTEECLHVSS